MTFAAPTVLRGSVRIPTSKPHTQRALLMAALARGESTIRRPNLCSESCLLAQAAAALGARLTVRGETLVVNGFNGRPRTPASVLEVAGSGFALRHLIPITALAEPPCVLAGEQRLAARPVQPLLEALAALGNRVEPAVPGLVLPLITRTTGIAGGQVDVPALETSQFVSALMLAAPYAVDAVSIRVPGVVVSRQYIRLTRDMMDQFGARASVSADTRTIDVVPGGYQATDLLIGPDVTSLFYFIAAAVIVDADILINDVVLGGDVFLDSAAALGRRLGVKITQEGTALRIASGPPPADRVVIDACDIPTLVPALAALASSLPSGMLLRNARHIQHHKTSRLRVVLDAARPDGTGTAAA